MLATGGATSLFLVQTVFSYVELYIQQAGFLSAQNAHTELVGVHCTSTSTGTFAH